MKHIKRLVFSVLALTFSISSFAQDYSESCAKVAKIQLEKGFLCQIEELKVDKADAAFKVNPSEENKKNLYSALKEVRKCVGSAVLICEENIK